MEEEIITFETAKLAKEKGFDWKCLSYYSGLNLYSHTAEDYNNKTIGDTPMHIRNADYYSAPTQSLLQKWLREEKDILIYVDPRSHHIFQYHIITDDNEIIGSERLDNWEQTLEKGLQEALKLIKL